MSRSTQWAMKFLQTWKNHRPFAYLAFTKKPSHFCICPKVPDFKLKSTYFFIFIHLFHVINSPPTPMDLLDHKKLFGVKTSLLGFGKLLLLGLSSISGGISNFLDHNTKLVKTKDHFRLRESFPWSSKLTKVEQTLFNLGFDKYKNMKK